MLQESLTNNNNNNNNNNGATLGVSAAIKEAGSQ